MITDSSRGLTSEVVTILVGPTETPFSIHRGLLTSKSAFFNAALAGSWQEATSGTVRLSDEDPELFTLYFLWMYDRVWTKDERGEELTFNACCRLYVLADKLASETLQNLAIDKLREYGMRPHSELDVGFNIETISFVYGATLRGSVLRNLVVDILAWRMKIPSFRGLIDAAPECLYDALRVCTKHMDHLHKGAPPYKDKSAFCKKYHVHRDGDTCCSPAPNPGTGDGKSQA